MRIKLVNRHIGRNENTFRTITQHEHFFKDIDIEFVEDGSYDMEFIGMNEFINKNLPLEDSIQLGLLNLSYKEGPYCLFDGSDSTSLMGAYEVFSQSAAKFLFKPQLTTREQYNIPSPFGKWFWQDIMMDNDEPELSLSYDISQETYNRIKLSGWNLGYFHPEYLQYSSPHDRLHKEYDICAIFQTVPKQVTRDHRHRNDSYYNAHRYQIKGVLNSLKGVSIARDRVDPSEFYNVLAQSKCAISPFGMGEICFRDFEVIKMGSVLIKPDMSLVRTVPNIYIPYETYIPCKLDYSDLPEIIDWVLTHPRECWNIKMGAREKLTKLYHGDTHHKENLLLHWWDIKQQL